MAYKRQLIGDFEKARREHPSWPVVISEGDSWFSFSDVIGQLDDPGDTGDPERQRAWALLRLEKAGDEILTVLSGGPRSKLRSYFSRWPLDALLFSAGGNDIIGPDLPPLLAPFVAGMTAADVIRAPRFERRLRQIEDCYVELLEMLSDVGQPARVFANSYDYVRASGDKAGFLGIAVAGPWIRPAFEEKGIPAALHEPVIRLLIDSFAAMLDGVAASPVAAGRLVRAETREVVGSRWKDEIHPNRLGAIRVAKAFEDALAAAGIL